MQAIYSDGELARLLVVSVWLEERADESDRDAGLRVSPCHSHCDQLSVCTIVRACIILPHDHDALTGTTCGLTRTHLLIYLQLKNCQCISTSHISKAILISRQRFIRPWRPTKPLKLPTSAFLFGSHKCSCVPLLPLPSLHSLLLKVWEFFAIYFFSFFIEPTVSVKSFSFCNVEPNLIKIKCNDGWEFTQGCLDSLQIQDQEHCRCFTRGGVKFAMIPADELDSFHACCDSNTGGIDRCWIWLVVDTA